MSRSTRARTRLDYRQLHLHGKDPITSESQILLAAASNEMMDGQQGSGSKGSGSVASLEQLKDEIDDIEKEVTKNELSRKVEAEVKEILGRKVSDKKASKTVKGYDYQTGNDAMGHKSSTPIHDSRSWTMEEKKFVNWLNSISIPMHVISTLIDNGCSSTKVLSLLLERDWDAMGISVGHKRLIQHALSDLGKQETLTVQQHDVGSEGLAASASAGTENVQGGLSSNLSSNLFLGMGVHGDQKPYLDICDFVSFRSPYDNQSYADTVISHTSEGIVLKSADSKKVSIDKVTLPQWVEANTHIMDRLVKQGVDARAYMNYTVMISQLATKYQWQSVLLYDREYRKMQANNGFVWGEDISHVRDLLLVPKQVGPPKKKDFKSDAKPWLGKEQKPAQGQKQGGKSGQQYKRDIAAEGRRKICRGFNAGNCTFENCLFRHFCTKCGSMDHGERDHPK